MLAAGQLRRLLPAAPALADRLRRDDRLPADPRRGQHRRTGRPAHPPEISVRSAAIRAGARARRRDGPAHLGGPDHRYGHAAPPVVHVGVWLRLLRTLLDEVSMAASRVSDRSAATLARVWEATGRPARGGLTVWRPYERLDSAHQQAMLEAAATAARPRRGRRCHRPQDARPAPDTRGVPARRRRRPDRLQLEAHAGRSQGGSARA